MFLAPLNANAYICTLSVSDIDFGVYDPNTGVPLRVTGTINVNCVAEPGDKGPALTTISIGASQVSGTVASREMLNPVTNDRLLYNLYADNLYTAVWGDGTGGSKIVKKPVSEKKPLTQVIYAEIAASQFLTAGIYDDTITIDVLW